MRRVLPVVALLVVLGPSAAWARPAPEPVPGEPVVTVDFAWDAQLVYLQFFAGPVEDLEPYLTTVDDFGAGCAQFPGGAPPRSLVIGTSDVGSVAAGDYAVMVEFVNWCLDYDAPRDEDADPYQAAVTYPEGSFVPVTATARSYDASGALVDSRSFSAGVEVGFFGTPLQERWVELGVVTLPEGRTPTPAEGPGGADDLEGLPADVDPGADDIVEGAAGEDRLTGDEVEADAVVAPGAGGLEGPEDESDIVRLTVMVLIVVLLALAAALVTRRHNRRRRQAALRDARRYIDALGGGHPESSWSPQPLDVRDVDGEVITQLQPNQRYDTKPDPERSERTWVVVGDLSGWVYTADLEKGKPPQPPGGSHVGPPLRYRQVTLENVRWYDRSTPDGPLKMSDSPMSGTVWLGEPDAEGWVPVYGSDPAATSHPTSVRWIEGPEVPAAG